MGSTTGGLVPSQGHRPLAEKPEQHRYRRDQEREEERQQDAPVDGAEDRGELHPAFAKGLQLRRRDQRRGEHDEGRGDQPPEDHAREPVTEGGQRTEAAGQDQGEGPVGRRQVVPSPHGPSRFTANRLCNCRRRTGAMASAASAWPASFQWMSFRKWRSPGVPIARKTGSKSITWTPSSRAQAFRSRWGLPKSYRSSDDAKAPRYSFCRSGSNCTWSGIRTSTRGMCRCPKRLRIAERVARVRAQCPWK